MRCKNRHDIGIGNWNRNVLLVKPFQFASDINTGEFMLQTSQKSRCMLLANYFQYVTICYKKINNLKLHITCTNLKLQN